MQRCVLSLLVASMLVLGGCESVTSDSIQRWKNTEKGPGKLEAAVRDDKVPAKLRAEAAVALVQIGRPDEVESALAAMAPNEREAVSGELVPLYVGQLARGSVNEARDARDGLFGLREKAPPAIQK